MSERATTRALLLWIFLLCFVTIPCRVTVAADRDGAVRLSWALVYQSDEGVSRPIDYRASVIPLRSGDRFKIYLIQM